MRFNDATEKILNKKFQETLKGDTWTISGYSVSSNRMVTCRIEDLTKTIVDLERIKQIIEDETGVIV